MQKNTNRKNPCSVENMTKNHWNTVEASAMVNAPNTHWSPNKNMMETTLSNVLKVALACFFLSKSPALRILCLTSTQITKTKMMKLTRTSAKIGPRNNPKNTPMSLMKQL